MGEILLTQKDDGTWGEYKPYATIVIDTEEDFVRLQEAVGKQEPKKPNIIDGFMTVARCPVCGEIVDFKKTYCGECGQKIDWGSSDE